MELSLDNSDTLRKKSECGQKDLELVPPCVQFLLFLPATPGRLRPVLITTKQLVFLKPYPRASPCSFTGAVFELEQVVELFCSLIKGKNGFSICGACGMV